MNILNRKKIPIVILVLSLTVFGNIAWADHGSMGFGLGTASPIVTGTGITLPVGTWAIGERVQFINYDTASNDKLLGLANANPPGDPKNDVDLRITCAILILNTLR